MVRVGGDGMSEYSSEQLEQMVKEVLGMENNIPATQEFEKYFYD